MTGYGLIWFVVILILVFWVLSWAYIYFRNEHDYHQMIKDEKHINEWLNTFDVSLISTSFNNVTYDSYGYTEDNYVIHFILKRNEEVKRWDDPAKLYRELKTLKNYEKTYGVDHCSFCNQLELIFNEHKETNRWLE